MSPLRIIDWVRHQIPEEAISWVGPCPWTNDVAYGTESGKLFMRTPDYAHNATWRPVSSEAINGAAFSGDLACVTSGEDVTIFDRRGPALEKHPFGAHDVVALALGGFLAPLGPSGLMVARFGSDGRVAPRIAAPPSDEIMNYYRACGLGVVDGVEYFACASRRGGLIAGQVPPQSESPKVHGSGQFDFVDVCPLGSAEWPLAAACLTADGTLFFGRNMVSEPMEMLRIDEFPGRAYSLRRIDNHLIVLASEALLVLPDLVAMFRAARPERRPIQKLTISLQASEIFAIGDDLYAIEGDEAVACPIALLIDHPIETSRTDTWSGQTLSESSLSPMAYSFAS